MMRHTRSFAPPAVPDMDFGAATFVDTKAGKLAVYRIGTGHRTLVFWPSLFTDHRLYRQQAVALKNEFSMVFIDGCGHGASGPQAPRATIDMHALAVLHVLDHLQLARVAFVGTSWGGLVGSHLARLHPERLTALIALNTPYETKPDGPSLGDRMIVFAARLMGNSRFFASGVAKSFFAPASHQRHVQDIAEFKANMATFTARDVASAARTIILERQSALPWLPEIMVPTVVVAGREDSSVRPCDLKRAASLIPTAHFVEAPDSAHMSALESPKLVNQLIREINWHDEADCTGTGAVPKSSQLTNH